MTGDMREEVKSVLLKNPHSCGEHLALTSSKPGDSTATRINFQKLGGKVKAQALSSLIFQDNIYNPNNWPLNMLVTHHFAEHFRCNTSMRL